MALSDFARRWADRVAKERFGPDAEVRDFSLDEVEVDGPLDDADVNVRVSCRVEQPLRFVQMSAVIAPLNPEDGPVE